MKAFIHFFDLIKTQGILDPKLNRMRKPSNLELKQISNANIFILENDNEAVLANGVNDENVELDLPFKVCSIEGPDGQALLFIGNDADKIKGLQDFDGKNKSVAAIFLFLVMEISPKKYKTYSLGAQLLGIKNQECFFSQSVVMENFIGESVGPKHLIDRINSHSFGFEPTKERIKYKIDGIKITKEINHIIHIRPKNSRSKNTGVHREIDWSHRFEVRGHWRKHEGIGKDREGIYGVEGFTWVSDHVRGPENLPLVKKVRILEDISRGEL